MTAIPHNGMPYTMKFGVSKDKLLETFLPFKMWSAPAQHSRSYQIISVAGLEDLFGIERKTVADLVGYCMGDNRARFERELHRLRGYSFKRLLVVGSEAESWRANITRTSNLKLCRQRYTPLRLRGGL